MVRIITLLTLFSICISSCTTNHITEIALHKNAIIVLGTAQDAGSPHMNCRKDCCISLWDDANKKTNVVSLAIYDHELNQNWLFEATPDIAIQLNELKELTNDDSHLPSGVFLTHAHIGHYTGLQFFGKEAMGANEMPVYAMPNMKSYLESNGPWSQLVTQKNIQLNALQEDSVHSISKNLKVKPVLVPHRDEYSETVGYYIFFKKKTILFIPDIDKWQKWNKNISDEIKQVDYAFVDATFYNTNELPNRDMSEIPHPFVVESMELFDELPIEEKKKVYFIHLNHSNPLLKNNSQEQTVVS
ncbi:MAG: MBL fold metallo-hydrolase, partial [Bacteroidia bacterium]|nr:MBL fold metallo-hydrolase [Bacteroidia bacterium]